MKLKKYNVFYDTPDIQKAPEISYKDLENRNKLKAIKDIPPE